MQGKVHFSGKMEKWFTGMYGPNLTFGSPKVRFWVAKRSLWDRQKVTFGRPNVSLWCPLAGPAGRKRRSVKPAQCFAARPAGHRKSAFGSPKCHFWIAKSTLLGRKKVTFGSPKSRFWIAKK